MILNKSCGCRHVSCLLKCHKITFAKLSRLRRIESQRAKQAMAEMGQAQQKLRLKVGV